MKNKSVILAVIVSSAMLFACSQQSQIELNEPQTVISFEEIQSTAKNENIVYEEKANIYDTLNVATYLTKIGDMYFLSDCYHNRILYNDNLQDTIAEWKVLTDEVHYAHTIAGDGTVLMIDDTENNRVLTFENVHGRYVPAQVIENVGMKPHYVQYDEKRKEFLAWSSITGEMYYFRRNEENNQIVLQKINKIDELYGIYVRSFTIAGDEIFFVSGHNNQKIIIADLDTLEIKKSYEVSPQIAGMVQLIKIQDYFYITVSTDSQENQDYATIIRTKDLNSLKDGIYEDIYNQFGISGGTPYYITQIDGMYYMTHHRTAENVLSFEVINNEIENINVLY